MGQMVVLSEHSGDAMNNMMLAGAKVQQSGWVSRKTARVS